MPEPAYIAVGRRDPSRAQLEQSTNGAAYPNCWAAPSLPESNPNDAQGCTETFVYRPDGAPLKLLHTPAKDTLTQRYWYELDGHGDVVALTDASGAVVDRYSYDPWGVPTATSEQAPQPLRYTGYVYDAELRDPTQSGGSGTGWYWLSVREYDPRLERFLQPDPSEQEGVRTYVYCNDDPLDCADLSGLAWWDDVKSAIGTAALVTGIGLLAAGSVVSGAWVLEAGFGAAGATGLLGLDVASASVVGPALFTAGARMLTPDPAIAPFAPEGAAGGGALGIVEGDAPTADAGAADPPGSPQAPVAEPYNNGVKLTKGQ